MYYISTDLIVTWGRSFSSVFSKMGKIPTPIQSVPKINFIDNNNIIYYYLLLCT